MPLPTATLERLVTTSTTDPAIPRAGMLATVRNRRGVVAAVAPFDGETGRLHLVHLEYTDDHAPAEERLLWELEPSRHLLEPNALPNPAHAGGAMPPDDFDALLRAARWTALSPYLDPGDGDGRARREPIASPFHGGVRIESYQLVPLLKALRMPRVNLLISDDVGLGKTVEAGLILTELLLRRRIQRVLVLTPASLRQQWQEELWEKFSLRFEVVDRQRTERLRRRLGMDATPWRSFSRIVASYHYLRQPDVLEQFLATCRATEGAFLRGGSPSRSPAEGSPHLPWGLLIVDECHNLMPSPFGEDSELCRMLRLVAPQFEHRLFLSATPHNGHTRTFNEVFDRAVHRRLVRGEDAAAVQAELDRGIAATRGSADLDADATVAAADEATGESAVIEAMAGEIDLDPGAMRDTLEAALAIPAGRQQLRADEESGFSRLLCRARLHHGGLLQDDKRLAALSPRVPASLDAWTERQIRQRAAAQDGSAEALPFVAFVLEQVCGFDASTGAFRLAQVDERVQSGGGNMQTSQVSSRSDSSGRDDPENG